MSLINNLEDGKFVILAEIDPPKGVNTSSLFETADMLKGRVDTLIVTDMPSAVMSTSSIAISYILKQRGFDTICNLANRDRNVLALQSEILGAATLGIENIYLTEGENITFGDHPNSKAVDEINIDEFFNMIKRLQEGYDLADNDLMGAPKFNIGSYINSNAKVHALDLEILQMEKRIKQETAFFITPAIFDLNSFQNFINKIKHYKVPIIASVILLKSVATARFLNKHVDNVNVPDSIIERLYSAGDKQKESMLITSELLNGLKDMCQGVNILAMGWESKIPEFLDTARI